MDEPELLPGVAEFLQFVQYGTPRSSTAEEGTLYGL